MGCTSPAISVTGEGVHSPKGHGNQKDHPSGIEQNIYCFLRFQSAFRSLWNLHIIKEPQISLARHRWNPEDPGDMWTYRNYHRTTLIKNVQLQICIYQTILYTSFPSHDIITWSWHDHITIRCLPHIGAPIPRRYLQHPAHRRRKLPSAQSQCLNEVNPNQGMNQSKTKRSSEFLDTKQMFRLKENTIKKNNDDDSYRLGDVDFETQN